MSIGTPAGQLIIENATVLTNNINVQDKIGVATNSPQYNLDVHGTANVGVLSALNIVGDGGLLSNIASNLQQITDNGNVTSNTVQFTNPTTAFVTDPSSSVGLKLDQLSNVVITSPPQADQLLMYDGSNWINDFNLHNFIKVYNDTGSTLYRGNTVYIVDSHNQNVANVALARSDSSTTMPAIGLIHEDVLDGQEGAVVAYGKVDGINTTGYTEGQTVYVSNTSAGNIMNTKPYGLNDKIQNVGICIKVHASNGVVFVTGVGRSNDIPNAPISSAPNYVYVNETNNDMKKITPENLLTKLQTLEQVVNTGNVVSNIIQVTGLTTTENVSIGGLTTNYFPIVGAGNFLEDSQIRKDNGSIIISGDTEITGNLFVTGNSYIVSSNNVIIEDRIIGIANNNPSHDLDTGIIIEHPGHNIGLIHHGDEDRFSMGYTQNTVTDDHVLQDPTTSNVFLLDVLGNVRAQNNMIVVHGSYYGDGTTLTGVATDSELQSNVTVLRGEISRANTITFSNATTGLTVSSNVVVDGNVTADYFVGDGSNLTGISGGIDATQTLALSNVTTGLTADSNVVVTGNVTAGSFIGDGSQLTGVATSLNNITEVDSNVGISNTNPQHTLAVGSNLWVEDAGSNVLTVLGNVAAVNMTLDSITLATGHALDYVTSIGNTTSNTVQFTNPSTGFVTTSNVGIANANPIHTLDVGSNLWVEDVGSNVLYVDGNVWSKNLTVGSNLYVEDTNSNVVTVEGNVSAHNLWLGSVEITPSYTLQQVTSVGNVTTSTVQFTNPNVGIVSTGGIVTHSGGFNRKTYAYSNVSVPTNFSNVGLTFASNVFYAKITAQLTHGNEEVSTLVFDAQGGTRDGTTSSLNIATGSGSLFGNTNTKPWSATIQKTPTKLILEPSAVGATNYGCDLFVEYMSSAPDGQLESISIGTDIVKTFIY